MIPLFQALNWQMTAGERAAFAGVVSELKPQLAIEIGSAEGGSLACIAAHAREVHSFDLVEPSQATKATSHVTRHIGDSHTLLSRTLEELERRGANVDFALVDGDHTADGVRRDVEDLLDSEAVRQTVILLHDTANEEVRSGLDAVPYSSYRKVKAVDLDFVPGYLVHGTNFHHQLWGGLGLIVVDEEGPAEHGMHLVSNIAYPVSSVLAQYRDRVLNAGAEQGRLEDVTSSRSSRSTTPLRRLAATLRRRTGRTF